MTNKRPAPALPKFRDFRVVAITLLLKQSNKKYLFIPAPALPKLRELHVT